MKTTNRKMTLRRAATALLLCVLTMTVQTAWADYGWYSGSMKIGGITTDCTAWSTDSNNPTDLGNVTNMTISEIAFNVWSDANNRGGANMYFRIWDGGTTQVGDDQDLHLGEATRIAGDHDFAISWTGTLDLAAEVGLTLEQGKTYYIDMWAKTYSSSNDEWYSGDNSSNYHAKVTCTLPSYIDENGNLSYHEAIVLNDDFVDAQPLDGMKRQLPGGWYITSDDTQFDNYSFSFDGDVHLILADDVDADIHPYNSYANTITVNGDLTIYGQSEQSGSIVIYGYNDGIDAGNVNIYGGSVAVYGGDEGEFEIGAHHAINASSVYFYGGKLSARGGVATEGENGFGIYANRVHLSWRNSTDRFYANSIDGYSYVASGKRFTDGTNIYSGDGVDIAGKTLQPAVAISFADNITATGGVITSGNNLYAKVGDIVTFSKNVPAGYSLVGITVTPSVTVNDLGNDSYSFTMPAGDVSVSLALDVIDWATEGNSGDDADHAYMIYNKDQLLLLAHRVNGTHGETANRYTDKFFKLGADIAFSYAGLGETESNYEAIGSASAGNPFNGNFDGGGHTISGIRLYKGGSGYFEDGHQGLFGWTEPNANVHHVTLADAIITGYVNTGGIVGLNYGIVDHCNAAADVFIRTIMGAADFHGGIVGRNYLHEGFYNSTVTHCTSAATLTLASSDFSSCCFYGAIAGCNNGIMSDNLAVGATVPAADNGLHGAICVNDGGTLARNYYHGCTVAGEANATGVGCSNIVGNDVYTDDLTDDYGAMPARLVTFSDNVTATPAIGTDGTNGFQYDADGDGTPENYYRNGIELTLSYSGEVLVGTVSYSVNSETISGNTFTVNDDAQVVASIAISYIDENGVERLCNGFTMLTGGGSATIPGGWYVAQGTVNYTGRLTLSGDVTIILADDAQLNLGTSQSRLSSNCIIAPDGKYSLTIYGQANQSGHLSAYNSASYSTAVYVKSYTQHGGNVTIDATGSTSLWTHDNGNFTLSRGNLTVNSSSTAIRVDPSRSFYMSGGSLTATSSGNHAISSGYIYFTGGDFTAIATNGYKGIYATIRNLSWANLTDHFYVSSIYGSSSVSVNIASGKTFYDENGNTYTNSNATTDNIAGKNLRPYDCRLILYDAANNSSAIASANGKIYNVTMSGRTLWKDGNWNTLCLPFNVGNSNAEEGHHFDGTPLVGATVMELDGENCGFVASTGTLNLYFKTANAITAGTPYIIKWNGDGTNNLVNPVFTNVSVSSGDPTSAQSTKNDVAFTGSYSPAAIAVGNKACLFLGIGKNDQDEDVSTLYYPDASNYGNFPNLTGATADNYYLGAFRAYFKVNLGDGLGVYPAPDAVRQFVLNFGDETNAVFDLNNKEEIINNNWYSLDGVKLDGKPTKKGLYIHGDRKVVVP